MKIEEKVSNRIRIVYGRIRYNKRKQDEDEKVLKNERIK